VRLRLEAHTTTASNGRVRKASRAARDEKIDKTGHALRFESIYVQYLHLLNDG